MRVVPALVTLALLASARGGPISSVSDDDRCATKCIASQKFKYTPGTTYEFDYLAQTSTSMEDASEDTARLSIAATALVRVISDCDMVLQLRDVRIQESDPDSHSMRSAPESARAVALLERQPLRFSFQDGIVEELCPSENDELWALNVKRGVLSAFQTSMSRLDSNQTLTESDVSGKCPAEYHVQNTGWYSTTVKRTKDLLACTDRHDYQTALTATPYVTQSSVQSMPLMKSTHECEQTIDQYGIMSSATCTERHLFRPFSKESSGALTKVSQSLKYKKQSRSSGNVHTVTKRVGLTYEHGNQEEISQKARREAEEVLRQLCRDTANDIRPDTPRLFSALVSVTRKVDASDLRALFSKLEPNTLCPNNIRTKKFFVDALPMVGTEATVTMMTQMLMKDAITGVEADMWLTSLALIQEPVVGMLEQVQPLLKKKSTQEKALLPVSTMVNKLCRREQDCGQLKAVQNIMDVFEGFIGSSCYVNKKNLEQVLLGLRAIGNAGHVTSSASLLNKCVSRSRNPLEVRVAAAQAFRRMPCDASRDVVMDTFKDSQEDSELRIAAYLAVMTCPDEIILQQVQTVLESETNEQVGSFVWSHLTNLQETSSPHKQAVRQLLEKVKLAAKFDLGRLQFSRNYEGSAFLKRVNSGAAAESNLVWSSSSSMPRSASANLTVDLFGQSLNLLDVGLRLEGLEYLLETMLGPYGYFGDKESAKQSQNKLDDLKGSLYMRMFGNEMTYQRFQGLKSFNSATSFNMLDFLIKLSKNHDIAMTHSMEFLDTEMTVPTSCGLPLSLTVKGTATVDLKASGKMDLRKVAASPRSLQIDGEIKPSGAVRVSGQMSVDAMVSRAALHVTGTLHSSSALKGCIDLERGRVLSVQLDVPEDKMEIFHVSSEFSIVHNTVEKKQKMITENRQTVKMCTGDMTSQITGLEVCGELQYPNASTRAVGPYFPLTGPFSLGLTLHKRDTHTSYKLMAKRVENKKSTIAQLSFNTPGSKVNRALAFDFVLDHKDKQLEISAASPWKKAEFKGAVTATKKLVGVRGSFITDDVNTYAVTTEVKMDETKNSMTYRPLVEIRVPEQDNIALTGMITVEGIKSVVADLSLAGLTAQSLTLKTVLTNTKKEVSLSGSVANGDKQEYSLRAGTQMNIAVKPKNTKLQVTPFLSVNTPRRQLVSATGSVLYNQGKILKGDVSFRLLNYKPASAKLTATVTERKAASRYFGRLDVKSSLVSSRMDATVNVNKGRLINGRSTVSYTIPRVARDKIVMLAKLSDRSTKAYSKYSVRTSVDSKNYPDYNTAVSVNLDHKKKVSSGSLEVKYGKNPKDKTKRVLLSATLARKIKNLYNIDLNYKMEALAPQHNVDVQLKGKHSHSPVKVDSTVSLNYGKGKDVNAVLTLRDKSDKLKKMNGALTLQGLGRGLVVRTDLTQAGKKQWEHNVNIKTGGGSKHSISTVYKQTKGVSNHVTTVLSVHGMKPVTLSGQANLDWENLQLGASLKHGENLYGVSGTHKLAKSRSGKWSMEVTVPSRRVLVNAEGGKVKGNYEASFDAAWDADNDKNAKVTFKGLVGSKVSEGHGSHKAKVSVTTPLDGWDNVMASVVLDSSDRQHELSTDFLIGSKKNVISSTLVVATPFNPRHVDVAFKVKTPFKGYGSMGLALTHNLDSALSTKLTANVQKERCEISLTAQNRGSSQSRDLEAQLNIVTSIRKTGLRSFSIAAAHKDNGRHFANNVDVKLNGKAYSYVMTMDIDTGSNTGSISLTWPEDKAKTTWSHRLSTNKLASTTTTTWGANKRMQIDIIGYHVTGSVNGSLAVQTPWAVARDWRVTMRNEYGSGKVVSSSSVKRNERDFFSHNLRSAIDASRAEYDFTMTSPWSQPMSSKVVAKYANFPMTAEAEFSWEPRKKVSAEGSVILNNWDDVDVSMRVATPVRGMRSLAAQMSNKVEGSEVIGQVTIDLGMRKDVGLVTRVQRDMSGARVKLTTPWSEMHVMDTGFEVKAGKAKVDFKAMPLVPRYEAVAAWSLEDDFSASLRLNTPRDDFPYVQILASSKDRRNVRVSRVELEYAPGKTFTLDATYSFMSPLVLDFNVATPLSGYESLSASLRHNMRDTALDASAQITCFNEKTMKATAMMDWSRGLDTSLTVNTPFAGWEQSSATLRHEGELNDFNSVADVTVGGESVTGNLKLTNKMNTDVQLSITTPWAGWEKIEAGVSRKGDLTNLRGSAMLVYGNQKMEASLLNKWNSRRTRMEASVSTPFTQDLSLNVQQIEGRKAAVTFNYGREYNVMATGNANYNDREAIATSNIKYRLGGRRHVLTASLAQIGSLQDLSLTASASVDKQEVSLTAELNTLRDIKAAVAVRTPFGGFESLGATFQNTGDLSGMTTEANVEYMTNSNVNGKMELSYHGLNHLSFRGSLTSPLSGFERNEVSVSQVMGPKMCSGSFNVDTTVADMGSLEASFQKTGHWSNMKGEARVVYNTDSLLEVNVMNKLGFSRLLSSLRLTSPVLPELNVELNHRGSSAGFATKAKASAGGDKVSSETEFTLSRNNMDLTQSLASTLNGKHNKAAITFSRVGPLSDITLQLTGNVNTRKAKITGKLATLRDVTGSVEAELPFKGYRQMGAIFQKTGDLNDVSVIASANKQNKKVEIAGKFNTKTDVKGSVDITTPFYGYSQMGASFSYGSHRAMITGNVEGAKIEASGRFVNNDVVEGNVDVKTPFDGYKQMGASFSYGDEKATIAGNVEGDKIEASGRFVNNDVMEGNVDVKTPFNGYKQMGTSFTYGGDRVTVTGNVEGDKIEASGHFVNNDVMEGVVDVKTPFNGYKQVGASFTYGGDSARIAGNVEGDKIEASGRFVNNDVMEGNVDVKTPFNGYKQMGASFRYGGDRVTVTGKVEGDKIEASGNFVNNDVIEGAVEVKTPFNGYTQMGASFNYNGDYSMTVSGNVENKKVEATTKREYDTVTLVIATPFNGYRQMGASFNSRDNGATASANLENEKVEAFGNLFTDDVIKGAFGVKTPFNGFKRMGVYFNVNINGIAASVNRENESLNVTAQLDDTTASLDIITPFTGYTQLGAQVGYTGDLTDGTMTAKGNVENRKVEAVAVFTTKDAVSGSVTVVTPFRRFRQVGASFRHTGRTNNFNSEGQVTYMDGKEISGKVAFYNYRLRRIETSAELKTPFTNWETTKLSFKHSGTSDRFECSAMIECYRGHKHSADLKVDLSRDQEVQLIVKTPYDGFRMTDLTHSVSMSDNSLQWNGKVTYGRGQVANSQLTASLQGDQYSARYELQTPFTSDLTITFDQQGRPVTAFSSKQTLKYGDNIHFAEELQWAINDSPLFEMNWAQSYTYYDVSGSRSLSLRREGPWNDVTLACKGALNGEEAALDAAFKNEYGRIEGNVKVNTPFEGYSDIGASFQHIGELSSAFNTEAKLEYADDQEMTAKLDFLRASWKRLEMTAELTTPFEDWQQTQAEYRHSANTDGFASYAGFDYLGDQHITGDLRVTSSPNMEVTFTVKTPFTNWEQMSATGGYHDDGWGKKEVSSKVDLGRGYVYTINSALTGNDNSPKAFNARVTTPHADWHTLEARVSHEGGVQDFKSSAHLSTPLLNAVSASASLRFASPFDLNAAASLDTPFQYLKDMKIEMVNGERGSQKTSHVVLGWSGDQEIVMDGTWRHDNSWYERTLHADVSLTSTFNAVRDTNWVLEHHDSQGKYQQKMSGSLNGVTLVDFDLATTNTDLPAVTLTLREPYAMLYSLSRTSDGAEAVLDWDRNDPSSNIRLTSSFSDSSDDVNTHHGLHLKAIHPTRTVGGRYNLHSTPQNTASQGEVYWGKGDARRLSYALDFSDLSRRSSTSYETKVKVGLLQRALQLSGAVSHNALSRQMDATFQWDADRDQNKQVAVKTKWTSGTKNTADVTLSLPAINQELRVQSEVAVNQGKTLLDATTALSYSQDASKVLTLSSKLQDTAGAWDKGSNYTLQLTLTHPHTDLDMAVTSHLGASDNRYSAAVDSWYLTSRRDRKNMALRGEIDQLRRQISMEMVSPVKKMSMKGEVKSVEPYSVSLTNTYDDDRTIQADLVVDTEKRAFSVKTNYDLDHPERTLVMKARYVNDTAIQATVYRDHVTNVVTDALLALRLNTSTLLHSRLHWRSASLSDLQDYAISKLNNYALRTKDSVKSVNAAVRDELSARYTRSSAALAQDFTPFIQLVDQEMAAVSRQLNALQRKLQRAYRRSPYLQGMGHAATEQYQAVQWYIGEISYSYSQKVDEISQMMKEALTTMTQYPMGQKYEEAVSHLINSFEGAVDEGLNRLTGAIVSLDSYLIAVRQRGARVSSYVTEAANNVTSHPSLVYLKKHLDLNPYIQTATNKLYSLRMPERYSAAIYNASSRVNQAVSDVMVIKRFKQAYNEVYQQGVWAYKYWESEETLRKHLQSIATLIKEIIQEEMEIYARHFRFLGDSHMTVWDPEHGEIQAELHLPVAMETLDSVPDVTPLVDQYNEVVNSVVPDTDTVQYFYDNYVPKGDWWANNTTPQKDELMSELKEFTPAQRPRMMYKRKYNKNLPRVAAI